MTRNAVIVRAGRNSTHAAWAPDTDGAFDLFVVAYEDLPPILYATATEHVLIPGSKVAGWAQFFRNKPDLLNRYDRIALLDDDLEMSAHDIAAAFDAGLRHDLKIWQPSLSWDSYFSHAVCLNNPLFALRYVNFIEMMCPFFTSEQLGRVLPLFETGLETGIDQLWCRLRPDWFKAYAILDQVVVKHARPVGKDSTRQGFSAQRNPYLAPIREMETEIGVRFRGPVAYAGVTRGGSVIGNRPTMAALSTVTVLGRRQRVNRHWFYKPILDHCRHILTRPVGNDPVDLAALLAKRRGACDEVVAP